MTEHTPAQLNWQWHNASDKPNVLRAQSNVEGEDAPFWYNIFWYGIAINEKLQVFSATYEGDNLLRFLAKGTLTEMLCACQQHEDTPVQEQTP